MVNTIFNDECIQGLAKLPKESINCCVTSPPYWGLRDYGTGSWEGGDPECSHKRESKCSDSTIGGHTKFQEMGGVGDAIYKSICNRCGAKRIDEQLGLEDTPEEYVDNLVKLFMEIKRVLKKDGTVWLNLGDSYVSGKGRYSSVQQTISKKPRCEPLDGRRPDLRHHKYLKDKDLAGIPWRVAFALQADGWYLRQDIIWHKPNPMPESVTDRCTKSHEYIFLLTKSSQYYFDSHAIHEKSTTFQPRVPGVVRNRELGYNSKVNLNPEAYKRNIKGDMSERGVTRTTEGLKLKAHEELTSETKNKRSVWTVNTKPYSDAHFAVYPQKLIEPCIKAGCPEFVCKKCGVPRERIVEKGDFIQTGGSRVKNTTLSDEQKQGTGYHAIKDAGWTNCGCNAGWEPGIVLDPFMGSGTTAVVARKLGRNYVGFELNEDYLKIAERRLYKELGMFL